MIALGSLIPRSRKALVLVGAIALVIVLGAGVWLGPIENQFKRLDASIAGQEDQLIRNLRTIAPGSKGAVVKAYQEYGNTIPKQGSTAEEREAMLKEIEKIASDLGLSLAAKKPVEPPKIEKDYESYQVGIEIQCNMKDFISLLYGLESSSQLLRIERFALDLKAGEGAGTLRGTMLVSKCVTL